MPTISAAGAATLVARAAVSRPSQAQGLPQLRVRSETARAASNFHWLTPWAGRRRRAVDLTDFAAAPRRRRRRWPRHCSPATASASWLSSSPPASRSRPQPTSPWRMPGCRTRGKRHLSMAHASADSSGSGATGDEASTVGDTLGREGGASAELSAGKPPPPIDPKIEKELKKAVQKTAATFAPRASTKTKNPAVPGTALHTIFEVQGYMSMLLGGVLSFNLVFPSNEPDIWRLMGMWSIWMFTIPSLRARDWLKQGERGSKLLISPDPPDQCYNSILCEILCCCLVSRYSCFLRDVCMEAGMATKVGIIFFVSFLGDLCIEEKGSTGGERPEPTRTHLRNINIVQEMIGSIIGVYNGKTFD